MIVFCWLLSLFVKNVAATFINMISHSQNTTKIQFQRQLTATPHKNKLFVQYVDEREKYYTFLRRNLLLTNNFIE